MATMVGEIRSPNMYVWNAERIRFEECCSIRTLGLALAKGNAKNRSFGARGEASACKSARRSERGFTGDPMMAK